MLSRKPTHHIRSSAFILIVYVVLSCILTWPLIFQLNTTLFSGEGDAYGGSWAVWSEIHRADNLSVHPLTQAPFGQRQTSVVTQPVFEELVMILAKLFNEVIAGNLLVLFAFPLTAFTMYLLLYYLLHQSSPAFVGGLIFGFCPGAIMQAVGGHLTFSFNMFIPLFILALFYNRTMRSMFSAFMVGISYALLALTSLYFGYFAAFVASLFVIFDYISLRRDNDQKKIILNYLACAAFAFLILIPSQYKIITHQLTTTGSDLVKAGHIRDFGDLQTFSARPLEYLLPSIDHPVFGKRVEQFTRQHLHESNIPEQTLYLGVVPILICFTGLFMWSRKSEVSDRKELFLFFSTGALAMIFLSLPPLLSFGSTHIPTISYFMYMIAPMFRVYARIGILANLFVASAAAVVLSEFSQRVSKMKYYLVLSLLLPILVFEYWSIPPHYARSIDPPPAVYQWLAKEPGDFIIAEYPMMNSNEASFYTYLFWQRIHRKPMINGATPDNEEAWKFFQRVRDLTDPETPRLLKSMGAKYVIVHVKMYSEGPIPDQLKRYLPPHISKTTYRMSETFTDTVLGKPFRMFGDDIVFAL